jgi:hypothetical protein
VVVYPQAHELSTDRPQIAKNHRQAIPQENSQLATGHIETFHNSTTPYYN